MTCSLTRLPYEMVGEVCRHLPYKANLALFCAHQELSALKDKIEKLFQGQLKKECMVIAKLCGLENFQVDHQLVTLGTIHHAINCTKIFCLRELLTANTMSEEFSEHNFRWYEGIVSVFKCVYQAKKQLVGCGRSSLEILYLQPISRHLINLDRYNEAIEVIKSCSKDKESALVMLVEDLASARAITEAKEVAEMIKNPKNKRVALEEIAESEESNFRFGFAEYVHGIH
jgi:hypothetical protein